MKTWGLTLSAVFLLWSFSSAHAASDAKAEITALEHKALASTTAEEFMAVIDEDVVLYDYVVPLQFKGAKAVRSRVEEFFKEKNNAKGEFVSLHVEANGELGVAHSLQHFTWTDKEGKPGEATFRVTDCWRKSNGQWKIFHFHVSYPLNPESGKVEMNLKE
jgi:ketosteroid isomerase-like protein